MNNADCVLRPEAGPVEPALLNRSQRHAFSRIVAALAQANHLAAKPLESAAGPDAAQRDRVSRLFFVSGQPGSGKTSLYLTLRAIVGQKERSGPLREAYENDTELSKGLSLVDGIRWLEPIDLEVAVDEKENLLAAVLVRISDAIRDPLGASQDCRNALDDLEALANDIGIAWDGNLKARAPSLDPDSYSQEVMREQATRLRTNERLRKVLETFFKEQCFELRNEQLFVLPIDDFYLKPGASLELLRLLRMISVPRLFFLIMGDIKTVEALFFEKALGDWTAVAGPEIFGSLEEVQKQDVLSRVREMKARYLRKLLPIGQRADVGWTLWNETLNYRPAVLGDQGWVPQMCHLLSRVDISWPHEDDQDGHSLLNYILAPRIHKPRENEVCHETAKSVRGIENPDDASSKRVKKFREAYSGLLILDATPRELFDLWVSLSNLRNENSAVEPGFKDDQTPPYLRMIVRLALSAIEEQDFLDANDQETLRFVFPGSDNDDLLIWTNRLYLTQKFGPWTCISSGKGFVRRHFDWELRIVNGKDSGRNDKALPPRVAAWIILLHDLVWNWKRDHVVENLVRSLGPRIDLPLGIEPEMERLDPSKPGWAWRRDGNDNERWVHFSYPTKLETFRQLDRFFAIWNHQLANRLSECDPMEVELDTLVGDWNDAVEQAEKSDDEFERYVQEVGDRNGPASPRRRRKRATRSK